MWQILPGIKPSKGSFLVAMKGIEQVPSPIEVTFIANFAPS